MKTNKLLFVMLASSMVMLSSCGAKSLTRAEAIQSLNDMDAVTSAETYDAPLGVVEVSSYTDSTQTISQNIHISLTHKFYSIKRVTVTSEKTITNYIWGYVDSKGVCVEAEYYADSADESKEKNGYSKYYDDDATSHWGIIETTCKDNMDDIYNGLSGYIASVLSSLSDEELTIKEKYTSSKDQQIHGNITASISSGASDSMEFEFVDSLPTLYLFKSSKSSSTNDKYTWGAAEPTYPDLNNLEA